MLELRAIGMVLGGLAIVLLALAATTLLAQALGSTAAAMLLVAVVSCVAAALALWRAGVWRERIGFAQTREALGTEPVPPEGRRS